MSFLSEAKNPSSTAPSPTRDGFFGLIYYLCTRLHTGRRFTTQDDK